MKRSHHGRHLDVPPVEPLLHQSQGGPLHSAKGLPLFPRRTWVSVPRQGRLGAGCPPGQQLLRASSPCSSSAYRRGLGGRGCRTRVSGEPRKGTCRECFLLPPKEMSPWEHVSLTVKGSPPSYEPFYLLLSLEHRRV